MREILFRGKGINDNEWRYGFYIEQQGYPYITPDGVAMYEVIPQTVGQFTEFVDKNGKKVFDGDLISILDSKEFLYILHWDDIKKDYILACTSLRVSNCDLSILNRPEDVEVVGNIYEEENK